MDSTNLIDLLISSGNYQHVLEKILQHFSGSDIHNFRCVKRNWRDAVLDIGDLQRTKRDWKKKLISQWETGIPKETDLLNLEAHILKIEMSGSDLFVDVLGQPAILVFDITTYELKHAIIAGDDQSSCWDVHEDFLLIFDGLRFFVWDRHTHQEIEVLDSDEMQLGHHYKPSDDDDDANDDDTRIAYPSRILKKDMDRPVIIKIYGGDLNKDANTGIFIVYRSGIASRWHCQPLYQENESKEQRIQHIKFLRQNSIDISGIYMSRHCYLNPGELSVHLPHSASKAKLFYCPWKLISVDYSLETDLYSVVCDLEGVDTVLYFHESKNLATSSADSLSHDGYILLTRRKWYVQDRYEAERMRMKRMYQQGELGGSFEEWLENQVVQDSDYQDEQLQYLEIHSSSSSFTLVRRLKVHNLCYKGACLNDDHMIVSTYAPAQLILYNAKELLADRYYCESNGISYVANPVPIRRIEYPHGITRRNLYMAGPNRLVFADQVVTVLRRLWLGSGTSTKCEEKHEGALKCLDFWMAQDSQ